MKCTALGEIKNMRAIRDEILYCDNSGRLRKLIDMFPTVSGYNFITGGWSESRITVRLKSGHEFTKYSESIFGDDCLKQMGIFLYHLWRDYIRKNKKININY